ncbi:MAG: TetR/AcrR family transcriptional regulator [Acidimicrobiales bacterium]
MSPRPRLSQGETEEHARRLVEAAFRVAAATGEAEPSVRSILREAGLSRQAFYRCFESKDDLIAAVLAEGRRILAAYLMGRMVAAQTPEDKVRTWVTGVMRQAQAASAAERTRPFIVSPPKSANGSEDPAETERLLTHMLEEAITLGAAEGAWQSSNPAADALIIHDFVFSSMRRHLSREERPSREATQRLADFALRGLGAAPDAAATVHARGVGTRGT